MICRLQFQQTYNVLLCYLHLHVCAHNYNCFTLATVIVIFVHFLLSECLICTCNNIILLVLPCSGLLYHGAEFSGLALHSGATLRTASNGETIIIIFSNCMYTLLVERVSQLHFLYMYRTIHTLKPVYCGHPISRPPSIIQPDEWAPKSP